MNLKINKKKINIKIIIMRIINNRIIKVNNNKNRDFIIIYWN
jgi:hypothetical protein